MGMHSLLAVTVAVGARGVPQIDTRERLNLVLSATLSSGVCASLRLAFSNISFSESPQCFFCLFRKKGKKTRLNRF